jgi:hypothetical protein
VTRTRTLAAALAAAVGFAAAGCSGGGPGEPPDPQPTSAAPKVDFTADVDVRQNDVHVAYQLVNKSGGDLYAFKSDKVYATGHDNGRVQLAQRAFAMPDGDVTWTQAVPADGVRVGDGQQITADLTVPLPLQRRHPYGDDYGDGPIKLPDPINDIVFCLGIVRASDVTVTVPAGTAITLPNLASTTAIQHLLCSEPTKLG